MESVARRLAARRETLTEKVHIPPGSLGIPRADMPQVKSTDVPEFLQWLGGRGVSTRRTQVQVDKIKPTQREIDIDKVAAMVAAAPEAALAKPVIISKDFYLLDGHHRWLALVNRDREFRIKTVQVDVPIRTLLDLTGRFPKTTHKRMGEARRKRKVTPGIKQSGLPKNFRSKITSINKAIKVTTELQGLWDGSEWDAVANRAGVSQYSSAPEDKKKVSDTWFDTLYRVIEKFDEWTKTLEDLRPIFGPENVTFFNITPEVRYSDAATEVEKEIYGLQRRWKNAFDTFPTDIRIPATTQRAKQEGHGIYWMRDRVKEVKKDLDDSRAGKPVDIGSSFGSPDSPFAVAMHAHNRLGNIFGYNELQPAKDGLRDFKDIVLRILELAPKMEAKDWKEVRVGKMGPFEIIYRFQGGTRFTSDESDKIKASVGEAIRVLRRFKIKDQYVSGMLVFTRPNDPRLDDAGGRYFYSSDELYVGWFGYGSSSAQIATATQTVIHELGHRVWGRLPGGAKKQWRAFFDFLTEPLPAAVKKDLPWLRDLYQDAASHGEYKPKRKSYDPPFRTFKWLEEKHPLAGAVIRLEQWRTDEDFLRVVDKIEKGGIARKFVTAYGNTTATEAFPEVFVGMLYPSTASKEYTRPEPLVAEYFKYILGSMREDEEDNEKQRIVEEAERRVRARRQRRPKHPR